MDTASHSLQAATRLFDDGTHTIELTEGFYQVLHDESVALLSARIERLYQECLLLLGLGLLALIAILDSTSGY